MGKKKLIVVSLDALIFEDLEYLKTKPTFRMLLEKGSMVKRIRSIYPSITYPCHTTMATGCYPDRHGIVNNLFVTHEKNSPWIFEHENVKCEDILDACKKAGLTTASVGWPVSGNHKSVDYLVNECWPRAGAPIEEYREAYLANGTPQWLFDEVVAPVLWMRVGRKQPESSYFLTRICSEMIRKYQPDILMLHQGNIDSYRHRTGVFSDLVTTGLDECEAMLTMLVHATKDAGVFEDTNFVVTADHGQLNASREVNLNRLFVDNGLIETNGDGSIKNCLAWCQPSGMSAQIYLSDPNNKTLGKRVYDLLVEKRNEGVWGISEVYSREEFKKMRLDGPFSFVVETDGFSSFGDDWQASGGVSSPLTVSSCVAGDHGFHPDKGPRPPFLAFGPDIRQGVVLEGGDLVDGAPTYAKILGVELPDVDGTAFSELLKG